MFTQFKTFKAKDLLILLGGLPEFRHFWHPQEISGRVSMFFPRYYLKINPDMFWDNPYLKKLIPCKELENKLVLLHEKEIISMKERIQRWFKC